MQGVAAAGSHAAGIWIVQESRAAMILLQRVQTATDWIQIRGHWVELQHRIRVATKHGCYFFSFESPKMSHATPHKEHATHKQDARLLLL